MPKNNTSIIQLFALSIILPLAWKFFIYVISPFSFVDDSYGSIRFLLFCLLVYRYFKPSNNTITSNIVKLLFIFLTYSITLYFFDIIIHFCINKDLKFNFLNFFYEKNYDNSATEELKSMNDNYTIASKDEMISAELKNKYSAFAYLKAFAFDLIKYIITSSIIGRIRQKQYDKKKETIYN